MKLNHTKSGFALVIALALMGLIVLLILSITTLVQVEAQSSRASLQLLTARQNAILGMKLAVGELQRHAGPDQRVSASADILPNTDEGKRLYTGVWDADENSPDFGNLLALLASQTPSTASNPLAAMTSPPEASWPKLVGARRLGQPEMISAVQAAPIEINPSSGSRSGSYAWWIGDEGVKASLALAPHNGTVSDGRRVRFASRHAAELGSGWGSLDKDSGWAAIGGLMDVPLLASLTETIVANKFHDYTPLSQGLLVDVRRGGLRRDLSIGLSDGSTAPEIETGSANIFPPQWGGSLQEDPGGPTWAQLRDFYNLRVSGGGAGTIILQNGSDDTVNVGPVITWSQIYVHALRTSPTGDSVRFYLLPAVAIWNPYKHNLAVPDFHFGVDLGNPRWAATSTPGSPGSNLAESDFPSPLVWNVPGGTWAPGEVKLFSMAAHEEWPAAGFPTLSQGWSSGYGAYRDAIVQDLSLGDAGTLETGENIFLGFNESTGGAHFYLSESPIDLKNTAFHQTRRWVTWSPSINDSTPQWHEIGGTETSVAPGSGQAPLSTGVHGNPVPRFGYLGSMKFAREYLGMAWIGYNVRVPFLGHYNPRSRFSSRSPSEYIPGGDTGAYNTNPLFTSAFMWDNAAYAEAGNYATGHSSTFGGSGLPEAAYFEMLREGEPVIGIGQLIHASLERTNNLQAETQGWLYSNIQAGFPIGNSLADPRIPDDATHINWGSLWGARPGTHYDQSWLLNDALWDRYYFSTVDSTLSQAAIDAGVSLPNPNLRFFNRPTEADLKNYRLSAAGLLHAGSFNINSISREAWKALLGGLLGEVADPASGSSNPPDTVPYPSTYRPMAGDWNNASAATLRTHSGFRSLNENELTDLADQLVSIIRERTAESGRPFLSLADFINRSLTSSEGTHRRRGAIQEAIDRSTVNDGLRGGALTLSLDATESLNMRFDQANTSRPTFLQPDNAEGDLLFGVASYLTQGDVLSKVGHFLSARSDTFRIRSHGSANNPISGATEAEVWIEALVQRIPEPVEIFEVGDPNFDPMDPKNQITAAGNFGRRFRIVSFRILDSTEL